MTTHAPGSSEEPRTRWPLATYRLQFHAGFTLADAARLTGYLEALGISDVYASPLTRPVPGSAHGYDVCDFNQLNPDLGAPEDFDALIETLRSRAMGLLLDFVPNHMAIGHPDNAWWQEVLQLGPTAPRAPCFDIAWNRPRPPYQGKVLLPCLEAPYEEVLQQGLLQLICLDGRLLLRYRDLTWPLRPSSWAELLRHSFAQLPPHAGPSNAEREHLIQSIESWGNLPDTHRAAPIQRTLETWMRNDSAFALALRQTLADYNRRQPKRAALDRLDALVRHQHYRLAHWRLGLTELNYRRFFDQADLAGVRVEDPTVFLAAHQLLGRWIAEGKVTGVRIDHPDGLRDPAGYFRNLQALAARTQPILSPATSEQSAVQLAAAIADLRRRDPDESQSEGPRPLYLVAEKILAPGESPPRSWWIHGTTGYDFLNQLNALFVDPTHEQAMSRVYQSFTDDLVPFAERVQSSKHEVLTSLLAAETNALGDRLLELIARRPKDPHPHPAQLHEALVALMSALPVYRTFLDDDQTDFSEHDRHRLDQAFARARASRPDLPQNLFTLLEQWLVRDPAKYFPDLDPDARRDWIMRFQQLTSPAMAKGLEDTAYYVYNRLLSLNEVGGHAGQFGLEPDSFHRACQDRLTHWPRTLLATTTHDTKRGEDVRARLNVLSEMPDAWGNALDDWSRLNDPFKTDVDGQAAPSRNDEYFLYQTLLGAWPARLADPADLVRFRDRVRLYLVKAAREAKVHTNWLDPRSSYEKALTNFADALLDDQTGQPFLKSFLPWQLRLAYFGHINSLAQTLLKCATPGVPDFYQGAELWDLSLVDPDNRRPVDFAMRERRLTELRRQFDASAPDRTAFFAQLRESWPDASIKLFLIWRLLQFRRQTPDLFRHGAYEPLAISGHKSRHAMAFLRRWSGRTLLVVAPRLPFLLMQGRMESPLGREVWEDTRVELPPEAMKNTVWNNVLTGETMAPAPDLATLFRHLPVAAVTLESSISKSCCE